MVVPFTVALNVTEYFPGGVAVPVGLFGRLAHAAPPKAISVSTANDSVHRGSRLLIVSTTPPNINPRSSTPSPPPDPPGVGPSGAVFAVQNVFSTIATFVGPPGVRVTPARAATRLHFRRAGSATADFLPRELVQSYAVDDLRVRVSPRGED